MMKCFQTMALLLALLSLAGCATVQTPPPPEPPVVAQPLPSAPEPNAAQAQPQATAPEPNEVKTPPAPIKEDDPAATTEPNVPAVAGPDTATPPALDNPKSEIMSPRTPIRGRNPQSPVPTPQEANEPNVPAAGQPNAVKPWAVENPQSEIRNHVTPDPDPGPQSIVPPPPEANEPDVPPALAPFYTRYARALQTYVRDDGLVDYAALDRHKLDLKTLLMELDELDPNAARDWSRDEKLAFWLNAYNLKMLEIITRNYPIQSSWWLRLTWPPSDIRHIKGIWTDYKFMVMDEEFTLAEVEQRFFRKTFDDPRVYLALAYTTRSGPPLRRLPYYSAGLDRQLDEQVRRFLASPQGLQLDRRNLVVRLSALFKPAWRGKEFLGRFGTDKKFKDRDPETRAVLNFLTGYLPRADVYFLEVENYTLEYLNFDWRLNDPAADY